MKTVAEVIGVSALEPSGASAGRPPRRRIGRPPLPDEEARGTDQGGDRRIAD